MGILENIISQEIIQRIGWMLIHFLWQAAAVALVLAVLLKLLRKQAANLRYIIACSALGLMVLLPLITMRLVSVSESNVTTTEQAPIELAVGQAIEIPTTEIPVLEKPVRIEGVAAKRRVSLKVRVVSAVEPALPYMVFGWLIGVFGLSVWHLGGWTQLQRLRRQMVKPIDKSLRSKLKELADLLGIKRAVEIAESALVQVPTVVGWLKPMILLPASALTGLASEQLEAILAHELAHIKRCDYLVNMLQTVVEILGFFHPAVWWVSHKIRLERENCCDDLAVSISGDKICYARALTSMEEIRGRVPELAVAATGGSLFGRISRLVGKESADKTKAGWLPSAIAILLVVAIVIPAALAFTTGASGTAEPGFVIKGTVTDAMTGKPIAGATVSDSRYAGGKQFGMTNSQGKYSYKSWYEEHNVIATAAGYEGQEKALFTKRFGSEEEKTIDFQLKPNFKPDVQVIEDKELNLSIAIPADWSCYKNPAQGRYKFSWQLLPAELKAWAMFIGSEGVSQADTTVRQIAVGDVALLKSHFDKYAIRENSWAEYNICETPAVSYVADYVEEARAMVEYRSYILGKSMVYWFVFRIEKDKFDSNKELFDSIVKSFKLKARI